MPPIPPVVGMCPRHTKEQRCGNTTKIANEKVGEVHSLAAPKLKNPVPPGQ